MGLTPGLVINTNGHQAFAAGGLRLEGRHGLTDVIAVWGAAGTILAPGSDGLAHGSGLAAGIALAFEVVRWVPFAEAGVTTIKLRGTGSSGGYLGVELAAGAEYLITPRWSLGPVGRAQYFPVQVSGASNDPGVVITLGVRLARTF